MEDRIERQHCDAANIGVTDTGYFRQTLQRLPLADAVFHLLGYALSESFLSACYEKHRGQCYEDTLSFARLVELMTDALLVHHGSARQALLEAEKKDALPTCKEAFYGKLRRLPLELSVALLAHLRTQITSKPRIIVADAQFCDLVQISQYGRAGDHFALRYHPKLHFHAAAAWPGRAFTDAKGRPLIEEYGWLGSPTDKRRRFVRRLNWQRTDHKDLGVVADLTHRQPGPGEAQQAPIR